jgi:LPS-assembly protein
VISAKRSALTAWLCASAAPLAFAQELCLPEYDEAPADLPEPTLTPNENDAADEVEIIAPEINIGNESEAQFSGKVEIRWRDVTIAAENASFNRDNESLAVGGGVTVRNSDVIVYAADAQVDTEAETISFSDAGFDMPKRPARGSAEAILIQSDSTLSLMSVLFTTCPAEDMDWELKADSIELDVNGGVGSARGVKLDFKGVPILWAPYFSFPINNERKSGFLTPDISDRDRTGIDISVPYYLNLAQNYDLTLEPRYMSERGTQLRSMFRYLLPRSDGSFDFEYLPNDDETDQARRYVNLQHQTEFGEGWQVLSGIEEVSDDAYFEDLGSSLAVTSQTHLNRFLDIGYFAPYWTMLSRLQNYQTIDPVLTPEERPYERVPQMLFDGRWLGRRFGFASNTELVNFDRDVGVTGWRLDTTQEVSVRFARAGMYLMPAVALRQTNYWLDNPAPGADDTLTRSLPISSLDTGLTFEREAGRDAGWIQTLEPRLLYVHVPFEDQSQLPVFDTILPDFNLVQLFRKYQFVGPDRVTDTDQVSFGVTTRLIDATDGRERLTATLGQTRYLNAQRVSLPNTAPNDANASDYVAEIAIGLQDAWNLDLGYQWNDATDSTARLETRFEYRPKNDRLFGFGYRYRRDQLQQGDFSLVWPAADRWRIIGQYSYSFLENEPLEQFLGWEYEACCWRFRMVGRRYVSRTGETDDAISIQLELKGLSQRASSPEDLLDRGILGYRSIAKPN